MGVGVGGEPVEEAATVEEPTVELDGQAGLAGAVEELGADEVAEAVAMLQGQ